MYRNEQNIDIVVHLLKEHNIRYIVLSPGGTNIPFVKAVQDDDFFICYSIVDERSAIYFAVGLYLKTGEIIAASCTSAQATRNYVAGLTEAFYKRVPILAITMSKHPRFTYQEYMQAPDQTDLPGDCVKGSFNMPFIRDVNDVYHSVRAANEAISEVTRNGFGPVQLNIPWLDFPLEGHNPPVKSIKVYNMEDEWNISLKGKKILVVVGEHRKFGKCEQDAIDHFCECNNVVVYTNHLSNFHNAYSVNANLMLAVIGIEKFVQKCAPDIILSIGGQTGDYPLYQILSKPVLQGIEHWRVAIDGRIIDTYDKLTKVFQCSEKYFFGIMTDGGKSAHEYFSNWQEVQKEINTQLRLPFSNASIAQYMCKRIPEESTIQFSILNSLRMWEFFELDSSIECYSNVGAFGIDGGMSTLIGQSVISDNLCFMVIGDLAFYYDMNAIGIRHIKKNLRILLINNNGGIEFKLGKRDNKNIDRYTAAANHFKNAKGWAETCGFLYLSAKDMDTFIEQSTIFINESDKPILLEAFVSDIDEAQAYDKLINSNKEKSAGVQIKAGIKSVLGEERIKQLKGFWKK